MQCLRCGHENEARAKFCSACGTPLTPDDETTLNLTDLAERLEIDDELSALLADVPPGRGVLVVRRGPNAGSRYLLGDDRTTIGRHPDSDVFLDDITVSRRHAVIRNSASGYEVSDAGSLNGVYLDRRRVEVAPLHHLADLQIGRFVLVFLLGGAEDA